MKKPAIAVATVALLALTGCTSEPEVTRADICDDISAANVDVLELYFDSASDAANTFLPTYYAAQEDAAGIEDDDLDNALRDVIENLEAKIGGQDGYVALGVAVQTLDQECRFA